MNLVNLTPHVCTIFDESGSKIIEIPSSGVARVHTKVTNSQKIDFDNKKVEIVNTAYGQIDGLPDPVENTLFIVSVFVANALKEQEVKRNDVIIPDTTSDSVIRDTEGNILGVKRFTR